MTATVRDATSASRLYCLVVLTGMSALNQLDRQLMAVLLEPVRGEFALSDVQLGLLSGIAFAALYTTLGIPAGAWAARHSRRNLVALSMVVWGAMTVACGAAQSFWQLFVARLGVGIGEAGGMPAAQGMISDIYGANERATAQAVLASGLNAGAFVAFLFGGYVGQRWGWRAAFVGAGVPTVLLALLIRTTVAEPARARPPAVGTSLIAEVLRAIWSDRALRHLCIGATLTATIGYGALAWLPSYLVRSHNLTIAGAGAYLALVIGLGGALSTWLIGWLSDVLRRHDAGWPLWLIAAAFIAIKPFAIAFYLVDDTRLALALFILPGMIGTVFLAPSIAVLHERVRADLRPVASAVFLLIANFIGLSLGPLLVGVMSESLFASAGAGSLRYALLVIQIAGLWGALHYYFAGRSLSAGRTA